MIGIYYIMALILGLCVGSFLNVVIYRVPLKMSLTHPNSHCTSCGNEIKAIDNIPVISYIFLLGKCRHCGQRISFRYPLVELLNALLWVLCVYFFYNIGILAMCLMAVACSVLIVVAFIDIDYMLILDRFLLVLLVVGIVMCFTQSPITPAQRLIGGLVGGGAMLAFYGLGYLLFKREAMGIGDIKLIAVCGILVGYQSIIFAVVIGAILGAIVLPLISKSSTNKGQQQPASACSSVEGQVIKQSTDPKNPNNQKVGSDSNELTAENDENAENGNIPTESSCKAVGCSAEILQNSTPAKANDAQEAECENAEKHKEFPFAPFLCFGVIVALFVGNIVIDWYLNLF